MIKLPIKEHIGVLRQNDTGDYFVDFIDIKKSIKLSKGLLDILGNHIDELLNTEQTWLWRCVDYFDDTDNQFRVVGRISKEQ